MIRSLILSLTVIFTLCLKSYGFNNPAYNQGYQPEQPIPYDHSLHAGTYKIQCQYCHAQVERSRHATVPSVNICMNCHVQVKTQSPWIQKIQKHYEEGKPIEWVKVHLLPDYVMFNHKRHVKKGVECQTCHGPIQEMKQVYQFADLSMGWCVNCHRQNQTLREVKSQTNSEESQVHKEPSISCGTCHY